MILVYHRIKTKINDTITIHPIRFICDMICILKNQVVFLEDYDPMHPNHVVLTFDDGYKDFLKYALPILKFFKYPFELGIVADWVGIDGLVIGFEPEPICYKEAVEKLSEKGCKNVKIYPYGLWSKKDKQLICQDGRSSSLFWIDGHSQVECDLVSLSEFAKENGLNKIDFIKMDIEGAEMEALKGCKDILIAQKPKLAICVYHLNEHLYEIILYLNSLNLGYKFWMGHHRDNEFSTVLYATIDGD